MEQSVISQETKEDIDIKEDESLSKKSLHSLILNKLCYDNSIFFIQESDLKKSSDPLGQIYYPEQIQDNTNQETNQKTFIDNLVNRIVYTKKSNILFQFLGTFAFSFLFYVILSPVSFLFVLYFKLKNKNTPMILITYLLVYIVLSSFFFYYYLDYKLSQNDPKHTFSVVNIFTFIAIFYVIASLAGQKILFFNFSHQLENTELSNHFNDIEIPTDQLFFETMDRCNMSEFLMKGQSHNIKQQDISRNLQSFSTCEIEPTLQKKVWNSGFYLLLYKQKIESEFVMSKYVGSAGIVFIIAFNILYYMLPQDLLEWEESRDENNLSIVSVCLSVYAMIFIINLFGSLCAYKTFQRVETFTQMLELKGVMSEHNFLKVVPSLNIYCSTSIKTWFYMRQFLFNKSSKILKISNVLQFIDVVIFISLTVLVGMDLYGLGWEKNKLYNNPLMFFIILTTILVRFFFLLIPIFFNFSYLNYLLDYNKKQIYSIKRRLTNVLSDYRFFRITWQKDLELLIKHFPADEGEKQNLSKFEDTTTQPLKNKESCFKIEQFKIIFEIIRNTELQLLFNENEMAKYSELNEEQKILKEMDYLTQLIETYDLIYYDMTSQADKYSLKFLGIISITYNDAKAGIVVLIPALFSVLMRSLQK